jgi:hypothetical protein
LIHRRPDPTSNSACRRLLLMLPCIHSRVSRPDRRWDHKVGPPAWNPPSKPRTGSPGRVTAGSCLARLDQPSSPTSIPPSAFAFRNPQPTTNLSGTEPTRNLTFVRASASRSNLDCWSSNSTATSFPLTSF